MFAYLQGEITGMDDSSIIVDVGGVGFRCSTTANTMKQVGGTGVKAKIFTYMNVREDAIDLFGFYTENELFCFKQLISVTGVGPKVALAILSEVTPDTLASSIARGDIKALTRAPGVGPKLAQRIAMELRDKLGSGASNSDDQAAQSLNFTTNGKDDEAIDALMVLGYTQSEAKNAVKSLNTADMSVEDIVRIALKSLMR
ncbi:MAG: Holliday junction branch migration protein RuvA [Bacillota bacterium]|nr:Holliday junction branch migration protein RuvA [Bacillota bacterium]